MRLKQIKLAGFKSFVDPTTVPFPDQMTAIVGPNGCGKSNIIDAVRWVLGESSAKNLRGDAMTDVIFNGSASRKPVSQASVELVFDNALGKLEGNLASRNEISIKRIMNSDAKSTYVLNGTKCRRKDITDIFLGTGLGPRSYAIIEQGMISRLIESKPQDLRVFIEEAAGISKYKERRRETELRIRHTRDNLDRLEDVREELGTQLNKLKEQAETAKQYKELKTKERKLKSELLTIKWKKLNQQTVNFEQDIQLKEIQIQKHVADQRGSESNIVELKEHQHALKEKQNIAQSSYYKLGADVTRLEQNIEHEKQRAESLSKELSQIESSATEFEKQLIIETTLESDLSKSLSSHQPVLNDAQALLNELTEQLEQQKNTVAENSTRWEQSQKMLSDKLHQETKLVANIDSKKLNIQNMLSRITELEEVLNRYQSQLISIDVQDNQTRLAEIDSTLSTIYHSQSDLKLQKQAVSENVEVSNAEVATIQAQLNESKSDLSSLEYYQQQSSLINSESLNDWLKNNDNIEYSNLLSQLEVEPDWQHAVEVFLSSFDEVMLIGLPDFTAIKDLPNTSVMLVNSDGADSYDIADSTDIALTQGCKTLSSTILSGVYPSMFDHIYLADDLSHTIHSVHITREGHIYGSNWFKPAAIDGESAGKQAGYFEREKEILRLSELVESNNDKLKHALVRHEQIVEKSASLDNDIQTFTQQAAQLENSKAALKTEVSLQSKQQVSYRESVERTESEIKAKKTQCEEFRFSEEEQMVELLTLQADLKNLQHEHDIHASAKNIASQRLQELHAQVDKQKQVFHQLSLQQQSLMTRLEAQNKTLLGMNAQKETIAERKLQISEQLIELTNPKVDLSSELQKTLASHVTSQKSLEEINAAIEQNEQKILESEKGQFGAVSKVESIRSLLEKVKLENEKAKIRAVSIVEQLSEMSLTTDEVISQIPSNARETKWQVDLDKTSETIYQLGAINLAAIEEFESQEKRKSYLDSQNDDLTSALDTLESAIRKIDRESKSKFKSTFDRVNNGLQSLFPKVFGGGAAYLALTEDDLLEAGVTIMARPPGKKNSTIHLLSGGEKALTALSLVFSIFRLNPAPFCMLDEVDAPLDDANVGRFCKLVKEMSNTVQFIYISHNKVAMEMATHLTGVTMHEPGVSRMVAVDVEEAVKMAELS